MKSHQIKGWLMLGMSTVAWGIITMPATVSARTCLTYDENAVAKVRQYPVKTGKIAIINNNSAPIYDSIKIRLFHSDRPDRVYASWTVPKGTHQLADEEGKKMVVGTDWGVQQFLRMAMLPVFFQLLKLLTL